MCWTMRLRKWNSQQLVDKGLLDRLHNILDNEFGRVTYTEAVELLKKSGHTLNIP